MQELIRQIIIGLFIKLLKYQVTKLEKSIDKKVKKLEAKKDSLLVHDKS